LINLGKLWIIAFCIFNIVRTASELRFLTITWLGIFALYPIRGALYNQFICGCTEFGRVAWNFVFENPNDLAALSLIPMGVAAALATVERVKLWRYAAGVGVAVLMLVILLTQSRGAMVGLGIGFVLLPLTSRHRARDLTLALAVLGIAAVVAPKDVWRRLAGLSNASVTEGMAGVDEEGSAESRWMLWRIAGEAIRDQPVTGVGLGMMPEVNRRTAQQRGLSWSVSGRRDTHSTYLRVAAETGIPGLLLYMGMWGAVVASLRRTRRSIKYQRPRDAQFTVFIELSVWAFLGASLFGTYGMLSFTYLMLAFVWLASDILAREPWYVPSAANVPGMVAQGSGRRR
jgi:O-antigen ligase